MSQDKPLPKWVYKAAVKASREKNPYQDVDAVQDAVATGVYDGFLEAARMLMDAIEALEFYASVKEINPDYLNIVAQDALAKIKGEDNA